MLKKIVFIFLVLLVVLTMVFWTVGIGAQWKLPRVYLFHSKYCPHCKEEIAFLDKLKTEMPGLEVAKFEVAEDKIGQAVLQAVAGIFNLPVGGVPITIVGEDMISGFDTDTGIGATIKEKIQANIGTQDALEPVVMKVYPNFLKNLEKEKNAVEQPVVQQKIETNGKTMKLPLFGETNISALSLPVLTLILGLADGFNPCAMWILVFLITLLLGQSLKRRLILGGAFIVVSGFMYFVFMAAWLNFFLFIGLNLWIRLVIGGLAVAMGILQLKEYYKKPDGGCAVTDAEQKRNIIQRVKEVVQRKSLWLALAGVSVVAIGVNLLEMFCSLGLPAVYTNILSASALPRWQYYAYLFGYIFFYVLDDLVVFIIAMVTLKITGIEHKYKRIVNLIGGIIIFILGVLLLLRPEWLMFS
jgi:cytochrome c biogenesis protein CcdA/thiol-disulfide isomerase/thioredoxin